MCKVEKFELVRYYERTLKSSVTIGKEMSHVPFPVGTALS